jgi:hypothetical protein
MLLPLASVVVLVRARADEPATKQPAQARTTRIMPLVVVAPGETKTVYFSGECTVDITRGGGLAVAEMVDGKRPVIGLPNDDDKVFSRAGVTVTVPTMSEAPKLDKRMRSGAQAAMARVRPVFPVTVTAAADAKPVAIDLHLLDATHSSHCKTDFTVVVAAPDAAE